MRRSVLLSAATLAFSLACAGGKDTGKDDERPDDPDADADTDADSDADSDADTDADTDTDVEPTYSPVSIDFDEQPEAIVIDDVYADQVTFAVADGSHLVLGDYGQYHSEPWMAYTSGAVGGSGSGADFDIVFTRPVRGLSFWVVGCGSGSIATVDVHTADGGVETVPLKGADEAEECYWGCGYDDFSAWDDITSLSIYDTTDAAGFGIDDLVFDQRDF